MRDLINEVTFGLSIPNRAVVLGLAPSALICAAERAENLGCFDSVWVGDNLVSRPRLESVVTLSAMAARTDRVGLGTICLASFPLRHPVEFAVQWASLDRLSGGRTILVVCSGASAKDGREYELELDAMGVRSPERIPRLIEGIEILRSLWRGAPTTHRGRFYEFEDIVVSPLPAQSQVPIIIAVSPPVDASAALEERVLRRVAQYSDGWQIAPLPYELITSRWQRIQEYSEEYGRCGEVASLSQHIMVYIDSDAGRAKREATEFLYEYYGKDSPHVTDEKLELWLATGSPIAVAEKISRSIKAGVTTPVLRMASRDQLRQLELCAADVMPLLRDEHVLS